MPDLSQLGYNADPNLIVGPSTPGEQLIYNCPNNTRYVNYDASGNTIQEWYKHSQPNGWRPLGGSPSDLFGTDSSTWQLNMAANGVVLHDSSGNLVIKDANENLSTLIVGNLVIGNITGYLKAIDGSIFADSSIGILKSGTGLLPGDDITKDFIISHNTNTINHMVVIYDSSTNEEIYPEIVIGLNDDSISFFSAPPIGKDHRAVIMGF
jgi:hypothetical protein